MEIKRNILDLIGNTPIVKVNNFDTGPCELYLKLENMNPGGSIKDRIALKMIETAEKTGNLKPGDTIVEATAGNTGVALAQVAIIKGYKLLFVVPDKMSIEKIDLLRAYGAEIKLTRSDVSKGHPEYYQDLARSLAKSDGTYYIDQFSNPANPAAHYETTGPEIWQQMGSDLNTIIFGVGTSGTITGVSKYLKEQNPSIEIIIADPVGSILYDYIKTGEIHDKSASWKVEGIGEDFIPTISDLSLVDDAISVSDDDAFQASRDLLRREGILAGSSSGTLLHAALVYCKKQSSLKKVLSFVCDDGSKYLSKLFT